MSAAAYRYTGSFGVSFTEDYQDILNTHGIESWTPLFDAEVDLGDVIIAPAGDPTKVWLGSSKYPGEGGTFSKAEVNTILKRFYDENL